MRPMIAPPHPPHTSAPGGGRTTAGKFLCLSIDDSDRPGTGASGPDTLIDGIPEKSSSSLAMDMDGGETAMTGPGAERDPVPWTAIAGGAPVTAIDGGPRLSGPDTAMTGPGRSSSESLLAFPGKEIFGIGARCRSAYSCTWGGGGGGAGLGVLAGMCGMTGGRCGTGCDISMGGETLGIVREGGLLLCNSGAGEGERRSDGGGASSKSMYCLWAWN
jgi:hypothetical protein